MFSVMHLLSSLYVPSDLWRAFSGSEKGVQFDLCRSYGGKLCARKVVLAVWISQETALSFNNRNNTYNFHSREQAFSLEA